MKNIKNSNESVIIVYRST